MHGGGSLSGPHEVSDDHSNERQITQLHEKAKKKQHEELPHEERCCEYTDVGEDLWHDRLTGLEALEEERHVVGDDDHEGHVHNQNKYESHAATRDEQPLRLCENILSSHDILDVL